MCQLLLGVDSAGKEEGRESLAELDCLGPPDSTHGWGRKVGCGRGLWPAGWELKGPGNRRLWAPACRLPVQTPRGTMDCLLGLGQERWVGVGEGKPGKEEDREAGQACSLLTTPLGLSVPGEPAPLEGRRRGTRAGGREDPGSQDFVSILRPPSRPG